MADRKGNVGTAIEVEAHSLHEDKMCFLPPGKKPFITLSLYGPSNTSINIEFNKVNAKLGNLRHLTASFLMVQTIYLHHEQSVGSEHSAHTTTGRGEILDQRVTLRKGH